jgi:hypothetical protein
MDILEVLKSVVANSGETVDRKNRAAGILAYIARKEKRLAQLPEMDREVERKLGRIVERERSLWEHPNHYEIYTDGEGVERIRQTSEVHMNHPPVSPVNQVTLKEQDEPTPETEIEPTVPMTRDQKNAAAIAVAREQTRGMLPSMNF